LRISIRATAEVKVSRSIALFVNPGEIVCVVGSNGVGKTALLRAISRSLAARSPSTITGC
jgi:ABC-type branched-subunit amino acid transport system ATPase component